MKMGTLRKTEITKRILIVLLFVSIGWYLKGRFTPNNMAMLAAMQRGEPHVLVQRVEKEEISPSKSYIANVEAIQSVDLRPQVNGYVEKVLFKEGSFVNVGDILVIIEQERYLAMVELQTAELKKAEAHLYQVEKEFNRQSSLNKQQFASEARLDNAKSDLLQAQASVKQAKANLDLAKINLNYTVIKAPISGFIGRALVTEGNFVTSQVLARIVQADPIRVVFSMTDRDFLNAKLNLERSKQSPKTTLILPNGETIKNNVLSTFTDNEANITTATVAVFIEYDNKEGLLMPGNYVDILVGDSEPINAILIPQAALAQDEHGPYVYVVDDNNMVSQRHLSLGDVYDKRQVVTKGLESNEKIVIKGVQKVQPGQKVRADLVPSPSEEE